MILYGNSLSPFVRKVLVFAAEKGVELEVKPTVFGQPDAEFLATSPFGKIPGFADGDFRISDSTAIVTYLEAKYPEPALFPSDPAERARAIWYEEFVDTILVPVGGKLFFNRIVAKLIGRESDLAAADKAQAEELPALYDYLEGVVPEGDKWLVGDRLTIADIAVASPFVNMAHCGGSPDPATHPMLCAYVARWFERPSLKPLIERETGFLSRRP
jgi:glutathione S-transferase